MAKETYRLTAPDGTKIEVQGADRRDTLLDRGYKESKSSSTKSTDKSTGTKNK